MSMSGNRERNQWFGVILPSSVNDFNLQAKSFALITTENGIITMSTSCC